MKLPSRVSSPDGFEVSRDTPGGLARLASRGRACVAALLVAAVGASCVYPSAPIPWDHWRPTFPAHSSVPVDVKVAAIEEHLVTRHLCPRGVLVYRRPNEPFVPGATGSYTNLADEPIWTGFLLAAFAFKYALTDDPGDRERVRGVVDGLDLLRNVTGKKGLLARAVRPAGLQFAAPAAPHQEWRGGAPPESDWEYRGDVSKDQYFGVLFGYAVATLVLGLDEESADSELRQPIVTAVRDIADHVWIHDLRIVDVDGNTTTFGDLRGYRFLVPIGPNAAMSLGWQLLAWRLTGIAVYRERYLELVRKKYPQATSWNKFQIFGRTNHNNDVMAMVGLFTLAQLEPEAELRDRYRQNLEHLWGLVRNEGNLFYHAVFQAASGKPLPAAALRDVSEMYRLFPVDLSLRPVDNVDHPLVDRAFFNGRHGVPRNSTALPLHLRPLSSFIWKSSPYKLSGSLWPEPLAVSGVDYLLAYWMGRYYRVGP